MKRFSYLFFFGLFFASAFASLAQDAFTGTVVYRPLTDDRAESDVLGGPEEIVLTTMGALSRWEESVNGKTRVVITDLEAGTQHVLFELLGERIALITPKEEMKRMLQRSGAESPTLDALPIAGYTCKQSTQQGQTVVYTEAFQLSHPNLPVCGGMPLAFTMPTGRGNIRYQAVKVAEGEADPASFVIPGDYLVLNSDQLRALFSSIDNGATEE